MMNTMTEQENAPKLDLDELLSPLPESERNDEFIAIEHKSFLRGAWERFRSNRSAVIGLALLLVIVASAILGTTFGRYTYDGQDVAIRNSAPSAAHWFGTDKFGRDLFTRAMYGTRISLFIGFASTAICSVIGITFGGISGYFGGKVDMVMMRLCDILYAIPSLLYVILIMLVFGANVKSILIGICTSGWVGISRITRGQVMSLKEREYALASYVLGASRTRIFVKDLLANSMGPIIVTLTMMIPQAIFMEAFLSFIGIGISAPQASLGTLAQDAKSNIQTYPTQILFPIAIICLVIFALSFISKGLEEALDPKSRR